MNGCIVVDVDDWLLRPIGNINDDVDDGARFLRFSTIDESRFAAKLGNGSNVVVKLLKINGININGFVDITI